MKTLSSMCRWCVFVGALWFFTTQSLHAQTSPVITGQPSSQTVVGGTNAVFSVTAGGQAPLSYQWSHNGANLVGSAHVNGATNSVLTIVSTGGADAGSYAVVVSNKHGTATSANVTLTVFLQPTVSAIPNQRTFANTRSHPILFTVGNAQSPSAVSVTSSDTNLIVPGSITLSNSGSNYSLTLMPSGALEGTTTITVGVTNFGSGFGASTSFLLTVTNFSDVASIFHGVSRGTVNWVDYDNDGRLDLFVSGTDTNQLPHTSLYHNNADGTFTEVVTPFANMVYSSADWADFNNDGLPDLALNGTYSPLWWGSSFSGTVVYRNDGNGSFTQVANIGAFNAGCVRWGDYDNDGKPDLMITEGSFNSVYHNNGDETFTLVQTAMLGSGNNMAAWVDYSGDGWLDVFVAGETDSDFYGSKLYRNRTTGTFVDSASSIGGITAGAAAWADFNNDGAPDLIMTGRRFSYPGLDIWRNNGGVMTNDVPGSLPGYSESALAAGDFNNDGLMDLFMSGNISSGGRDARLERGFPGGGMLFAGLTTGMPGVANGYAAWGDYDNDGGLDLVMVGEIASEQPMIKLYHNEGAMPDTAPTVPNGLQVTLGFNSALLTWNAASDAEQPGGLTYNVRIGTNANGVNVLSPLSDVNTGLRRVPKIGNAGYRTSLLITNLSGGNYFWSVQAIDNSFVGSAFASEQGFTLPAPIITNPPTNVVVLAGSPASFSVAATGAGTLFYQWRANGAAIAGATNSTFTIASAQLVDQGTYMVVVTNQFGSATSAVTLTVHAPPSITQQPQSQTNVVGSWPAFFVDTTGTLPMGYQWFFNGAPVTNSRASGANTNLLTIASALRGDAGSYFVVVSNAYGTVTSDVVSLAVTAPEALWNVDFGAATTSLKSGPAAVGQTTGDFWNGYSTNRIGVTNLYLADGTPSSVTVRVSGQGPVAPVNGNPDAMYHDYLYQYSLPGNLTVDVTNLPPGSFDFYYYAGCGDYNYQFNVNGVSQGSRQVWGSGSGSTNWQEGVHYAAFRGVTLTNSTSSVRVVITYLDSVCSSAVISGMQIAEATATPMFVLQPTNTTVVSGFDVTLTGGAVGSPLPISYQWLFNGAPLSDNGHIAGANTYSLKIFGAQTNDIGSYQLVATAGTNSFSSDVAVLSVQSLPPSFTLLPVGQVVASGSNFVLSAKAVGSIPLTYQWFTNGNALVDDGRIFGSTSTNLTVLSAQTNDSASYYVVASNPVNVTTSSVANVFVGVAPTITAQPVTQTSIVGSNANFSIVADGTAPLSYSWRLNGVALTDNARISGSAAASLSISNLLTSDAGGYSVVVSNGGGAVTSSSATLFVLVPPSFSTQPIGHSVPLGLPTGLNGTATGTGAIFYQWRLNGTNIPGAQTSSYTIATAALTSFGTYNLVASNSAGVTVSSNALVTLGPVGGWGRTNSGQCAAPAGLTNVVGIAGGLNFSASIQSDGSLQAWGFNYKLPAVSNAVAVSASSSDSGLVLLADGKVSNWGSSVPAGLSNITAVACGYSTSLFLRSDGTVTNFPNIYPAVAGLTKVTAIAAGVNQGAALHSDGTVEAFTSERSPAALNVPAGLSNVVAIATGYAHCLALKSDGRVVAWGTGLPATIPPLLASSNAPRVTAIAAGGYAQGQGHSLAVLTNGTVIAWGDNFFGDTNVPSLLSNVVAVAGGGYHSLALVNDGRPLIVQSPVGGTAFTGRDFTMNAQAVGNAPLSYQWNCNGTNIVDATNATLILTNVQLANTGTYQLLVTNAVGMASSLALPVNVINSAPFVTTPPATRTAYVGSRINMGVPVSGSGPMKLQWRFTTSPPAGPIVWQNVPGATNEDLVFDPVTVANAGSYSVIASNAFGTLTSSTATLTVRQVVGWGDNTYSKLNVPVNLTNAIAIAATGQTACLALRADGTPQPWGAQFGTNPPIDISNLCQVALGSSQYGLRTDGRPIAWGSGVSTVLSNRVAGLSNIVAVAAITGGSVYLRPNGSIISMDYNGTILSPAISSNFVDVISVAGGANYIALHPDGTFISGGGISGAPVGSTNNYSIATGASQGVVLRRDGTVQSWTTTNLPTSNIVAVAATELGVKLAVRSDGTVTNWGSGTAAVTNPPAGIFKPTVVDGGYNTFVAMFTTNDFPTMILPMALDTSAIVLSSRGSPAWYAQTRVTHDGQHAARSATLGSSTSSSMRTLVTNGPITMSFWWKVSSEADHDFLTFSVGGVPQTAISGEVDWQQVTLTIPAGPQMLVWTYSKDASGTVGMDSGFVDQLTFTPIAPTIATQPLSQTVLGGSALVLKTAVSGTLPLSYSWFKAPSTTTISQSPALTLSQTFRTSSGTYYVVVTNAAGSVTSSNAVLTVHLQQFIEPPTVKPDGTFTFGSRDLDYSSFSPTTDISGFQAQYSSNLVDWWPVLSPLAITNGVLQVNDTDATNAPLRFYRIIENW